jgi:hypothetical protein
MRALFDILGWGGQDWLALDSSGFMMMDWKRV